MGRTYIQRPNLFRVDGAGSAVDLTPRDKPARRANGLAFQVSAGTMKNRRCFSKILSCRVPTVNESRYALPSHTMEKLT